VKNFVANLQRIGKIFVSHFDVILAALNYRRFAGVHGGSRIADIEIA